MSFLKKQGAGTYLTALTAIASVVGFAFYMVNCGTNYFKSQGTNPIVTACILVSIAAQVLYLIMGQKDTPVADVMPVISGVTITVALAYFIQARVNGIAAIMTFTNNAQNMKGSVQCHRSDRSPCHRHDPEHGCFLLCGA